jgi:hypothetical protein
MSEDQKSRKDKAYNFRKQLTFCSLEKKEEKMDLPESEDICP